MNVEVEKRYVRALRGNEKAWGLEPTSTLDTVNNLGTLYADQGKMVEAEEVLLRALREYEKAFGTDHRRTEAITRNLRKLQNCTGVGNGLTGQR
jgi:hypothetical protein